MADPFEALTRGYTGTTGHDQLLCPVCGGASAVFERPRIIDPQHAIPIDLRQCTTCRHGWISPMPTQAWLDSLYASGSNAVVGVGWADETPHELTLPETFMVSREQGRPAGRYFELGVGKGALYATFLKAGWQCTGVDPGAWGKFSGVIGSIDELPADARFDLMAAFDVLEHVERPIDFLSRMKSAAALGASVYMSFPNIESFRARKQKAAWRMVRPLGHTHYYSKASVRALLDSAGFAIDIMRTNDLFRLRDLKRSPRSIASGLIQWTGQGDQLLVCATAR